MLFHLIEGISRVLQACYESVTSVLQECNESITRVLRECYKSVARVLQERCESVTKVSQECYKSVTRVLQECYKSVTRVLQERYRCVMLSYTRCCWPPDSSGRGCHMTRVLKKCYVMLPVIGSDQTEALRCVMLCYPLLLATRRQGSNSKSVTRVLCYLMLLIVLCYATRCCWLPDRSGTGQTISECSRPNESVTTVLVLHKCQEYCVRESRLRCVTLSYVMLCCVMLCYVILRYVMLCYVTLCHVMLCYVMLCYVMLRYVMLRYVMLCYTDRSGRAQTIFECSRPNIQIL
jgi:hypothetical protein